MPQILDTNNVLDGFSQNRRELLKSAEEAMFVGNRNEVMAPNLTQQITQLSQVFPSENFVTQDTGNAGITSEGSSGSSIRGWAGATFANRNTAPFRFDQDGNLIASSATISGIITATSGTIGGFTIGADFIRDAANSMGLASTVTVGDDVRFWAGATFANRATAPFYVTESGALVASSATINGRTLTSDPTFGDGSDGDVTIGSNTTMTRDMFYDNLIVSSGFTLNPGGYRIFCKTSATISGIISRNGNTGGNGGNGSNGATGATGGAGGANGAAGIAGTTLASGSISGSVEAVAGATSGTGGNGGVGGSETVGGNGSANNAGNNSDPGVGVSGQTGTAGVNGGSGGANGAGTGGAASGTGGAASAIGGTLTNPKASIRNIANAILMIDSGASTIQLYKGSASNAGTGGSGAGGGGRGAAVARGGGGGGAGGAGGNGSDGGFVHLSARTITVNVGGKIQSNGGTGGNGGVGGGGGAGEDGGASFGGGGGGGAGGGSGGNGGQGGVNVLIYTTLTNNGTIEAAGGVAGSAGAAGAAGAGGPGVSGSGTSGTVGTDGISGKAGQSGKIYQLQIM